MLSSRVFERLVLLNIRGVTMNKRFEYPFEDRYITIDGVRLHYIDEGEGPVIWMMHGMPMWSYVYRKMIPILVNAGYRCVVPDLMGFGLSDKPVKESAHTLQKHVAMMTQLIEQLNLKNIIPVGQDWGGPIALRYAIENKNNIQAIVILNTFIERFPESKKERKKLDIITSPLPGIYTFLFKNGAFSSFVVKRLDVFRKFVWQKWRTGNPSKMFGAGMRRPVDPRAMENYLMPHDKPEKRVAIAAFAKLIPNHRKHPNASYIDEIRKQLEKWDVPVLAINPDGDMAWKPDEGERISKIVPNGAFYLVKNAGHYLQEDAGEEVGQRIVEFVCEVASNREVNEKAIA